MKTCTNCIFCRSATHREPIEHIVAEGLVGDQEFKVTRDSVVLAGHTRLTLEKDEVCGRCNGRVGELDRYLIEQYGFMRTVWNRIGTKSGRPATAARPGMHAVHRIGGPEIVLNSGRRPIITAEGFTVPPAGTHPLAVRLQKVETTGRIGHVVFQHPMRINKRFLRAIHKIAFELLCLQKGAAFVLTSDFDPMREYILRGKGHRLVALTTSPVGTWEIPSFGLQSQPHWPGWLATIRLGPTFYVDLTPSSHGFANVDTAELARQGVVLWSDADGGKPIGTRRDSA
jgi:hypothetical protein